MSNINFNESKEKYNSIKSPLDLNINIETGMKSGKRHRKIKARAPLYSFFAILLAFTITINTSVAFAEAVKDIPILKDIAEILRVNDGIKYALKEGYIQDINKTVEVDGVKVTITRIIGDYSQLIIGYKIEGKSLSKDDLYGFDYFNILTEDGEPIGGLISHEYRDYSADGLKPLPGESYISIGNVKVEKLPKDLVITFADIVNMNKSFGSTDYTVVDTEYSSIEIELTDKIMNVQPEIYPLNKSVNLGDETLMIKEMRVYPMSTDLIINYEVGDNNVFGGLDNCYLQDEEGRTFGQYLGQNLNDNTEYTLTFNGGAYGKSKELTLYSDGMFYDPKEGRQLVVDLKNKTLIDGGQYGVELIGIKNCDEYKANDEALDEGTSKAVGYAYEGETIVANSHKPLIYDGVEIGFRALPGYGITMMNLSHPNFSSSSMSSYIDENNPVEAYLYFDELQLDDVDNDTITISMDFLHSNRNKTEGFSIKLK